MTKIKEELMEQFEIGMGDLEYEPDYFFTKEEGYKDPLTSLMYYSFVKGVQINEQVVLMSNERA